MVEYKIEKRNSPEVISLDDIQKRAEIKKIFCDMREQAKDVPEMSLDDINAEIKASRTKSCR